MYGLGPLGEKVTAFTTRIVKASNYLRKHGQLHIADQILRSGTSIGANCSEAVGAQTRADYLTKLHIALKEANETSYWIDVMRDTEVINQSTYDSIKADCVEICKILTAITKQLRTNKQN